MTDSISLDSVVKAVDDQVSSQLGEELVILNMRNSEYFGLNPVGARIWSYLDQPRRVAEIRDALVEAYPDVAPEVCTGDLLTLLTDLRKADLIEVS